MMDWDAVFQTRILPSYGVLTGGAATPRWVFVCGQPGSGKSTHIDKLCNLLGPDRTQRICGDALRDCLPELFGDPDDPDVKPLIDTYRSTVQQSYVDRLVERAVGLRAHVVWERPMTSHTLGIAAVARGLGYRVECAILAVPLLESWMATLRRETALAETHGRVPLRVGWDRQIDSFSRWPALLARAEDSHAFDEIRVIGRNGQVFFENRLEAGDGPPRWAETPFAFESLVVERLHPRAPAEVDRLVADWQALRADPALAFRNHDPWPWARFLAFGDQIQALRDDPATGFDLNTPAESADPRAAPGWIARLQADLADALASPEAEGLKTLAPRADRLLALVAQVAGQPTR